MPSRGAFRYVEWARDLRLPGARQAVLVVLTTHCHADGQTWLAYETLARETGFSRATVARALRSLQADGFLRHNGRRNGRANLWQVTGAIQPVLFQEKKSHCETPARAQPVSQGDINPSHPAHKPSHSASRNIPRPSQLTNTRSPDGDLVPPVGGAPTAQIEAFLTAPDRRKQVGALIDLGRALGVKLKGDRVAGIIRKYGRGQHIVNALLEAVGHRALEPHDYMEGVLRNANRRDAQAGRGPRESPGESARRLVEQRERIWPD